ncbi:MAG: DUF3108 domain-containing protein [Rhodospirillales bacterium]
MRFEAYWGGLHAANFLLSTSDDGKRYENSFFLKTHGIIGWFLRLKLTATSRGLSSPFQPGDYRVDYTNRLRERTVKVSFAADDGRAVPTITTLGATRADDLEKEAKVPPPYRTNVIDPITALIATFRHARDSLNGGDKEFVLAVYDGRRRFDLKGEFFGKEERIILGQKHEVYRIRLTNTPIIGFKDSHKVMWNDTVFDMYLSTDGRFIPLQFVPVGMGPVMNLVEECSKPCEIPGED